LKEREREEVAEERIRVVAKKSEKKWMVKKDWESIELVEFYNSG